MAGGERVGRMRRAALPNPAAIWAAHRQVRSIRSRVRRAERVSWAARVQHPVAERGDLAAGQRRHVREADQLGPADQVGGGEHGLQPGAVLLLAPAEQVPQARGLGLPEPSLGVRTRTNGAFFGSSW